MKKLIKGDKLQIHCYKHNGKINSISDEAIVLEETDELLIVGNYHAKLTDNDGKSRRTKEPAVIFFYKNNWFNIIAQFKTFGLFYYCNIGTPYLIDDNAIKYIDYDLDLRVFPDGGYRVLDKNEYKYHKKIMNYSEELEFVINKELEKLIEMKNKNQGPFNRTCVEKYLMEFQNIRKSK